MDLRYIRFEGTPPAVRRQPRRVPEIAAWPSAPCAPVTGLPAAVLSNAALDPARYRASSLRRRTPACLRALQAPSEHAAIDRLAARPELLPVALSALLIGVSSFFRDEPVFRTLWTTVLPALERGRRALRILSVGCSTGEELYSVAMMLAEAGLLARASLLGVDCRHDAVAAARAGVFTDGALGTLEGRLRSHYLRSCAGGSRIVDAIRMRTDWRVLDATRECPPGPWDVVLCRNLFIYLQQTVAEGMLAAMTDQLVPGGFLVVGKAERPPSRLKLIEVSRCVYRAPDA